MPYRNLWSSIAGWLSSRARAGRPGDAAELETLRNLLEAAPAAMVTLTRDGGVATWNRAAERLFGWKRAEVAGQPPPYVAPESGAAEAALRRRVLAGNELFRRRGRFQQREGEALDLLVSSVPQRDAVGTIIGVVHVFEDAPPAAAPAPRRDPVNRADDRPSEPPAAAAPMAPRSDPAPAAPAKNDDLLLEQPSQFLARVSHDLRQPLHALSLLTGALERRVKEPDSRELVANAGTMIRALQETFDNIVDLARLDEGRVIANPVTAPAAEMMAPVVADIARDAHKCGVTLRYVASSAKLHADPILLQRLLRQLLGNALRFARHADGTAGKVLVGVRRKGDCLRIIVADDGIGVPESQASAIFAPFFQLEAGRAAGGLGLGLAIAQRLARLLRGEVALRSTPGKGCMFWVDLPEAAHE